MPIDNTHIRNSTPLSTPDSVRKELPRDKDSSATVAAGREAVENILTRKDSRHLMVVGPCSIHDTDAAFTYAEKLKALSDKVSNYLLLVMRVYFEKPRTTWDGKGLFTIPTWMAPIISKRGSGRPGLS